jgi:hypothetical protein
MKFTFLGPDVTPFLGVDSTRDTKVFHVDHNYPVDSDEGSNVGALA